MSKADWIYDIVHVESIKPISSVIGEINGW